MAQYPEHEKLKEIRDQSQKCGEFLEWLEEQGYVEITARKSLTSILAEFFEIDEEKLEREKRRMLDRIREANARRAAKDEL
jgi:hypothetical protein